MTDECLELKNIKYKTMLLNGNNKQFNNTKTDKMSNIENFLEKERKKNRAEPWGKLDHTQKIKKIETFVITFKRDDQIISDDEKESLKKYLRECLNKKRLQRVKDVIYDQEEGIIKSIPNLYFNKARQRYTLKRSDKRVSTLKSLGKPKSRNKKTSKEKAKKPNTELIPDKIDS